MSCHITKLLRKLELQTEGEKMKYMTPIWLRYPEVEPDSIEWRMGLGEEYIARWIAWKKQLSADEKREYEELFPVPVLWHGYFPGTKVCKEYHHGSFTMPLWRNKGIPKYSLRKLQLSEQEAPAEYCFFWGHHPAADGSITKSCFSQWWKSGFLSYGVPYCCMEQYMMAQKAELFGDKEIQKQIIACDDPAEIKKLGRRVRKFDASVWDQAKYSIVLNGNWKKFSQNPQLRDFLLNTGDQILVEASPYDTIWGIGLSADQAAAGPQSWRGENLLGFALMEVRDELARVYAHVNLLTEIEFSSAKKG